MATLHDYRMCGSDEALFDAKSHLSENGNIIIPIETGADQGLVVFISMSIIEAKSLILSIEKEIRAAHSEIAEFLETR